MAAMVELVCVIDGEVKKVPDRPVDGVPVLEWWDEKGRICAKHRKVIAAWQALHLSDPSAPAMGRFHRRARPTELAAAKKQWPRSNNGRRKVLEALAAHPDGLTDHEIADTTRLFLYTAAPRRVELVAGGWVADSGRKRKTPNDSEAVVWTLTDAARHKLAEEALAR